MREKGWLVVLVMLLIFGVIFRLDLLIALSTALFVVLSVATWWRKHSLDGITYFRKFHYIRGFPGEKTRLQVEVENRKLLPI